MQTKVEKPQAAKQIYAPARISDITFEEMDRLFGDNSKLTSLQKDNLFNNNYKGKTVQWIGEVENVESDFVLAFSQKKGFCGGHVPSVSFKHRSGIHYSFDVADSTVFFPESSKNKLLQLRKGQRVIYQGEFCHCIVSWPWYFLRNGKIIKVY